MVNNNDLDITKGSKGVINRASRIKSRSFLITMKITMDSLLDITFSLKLVFPL